MSTRVQQDAFTDDAEDTCPLCVEEFDLSDRNFRPCPCGYQVCQFCYNNIKNNMNGLCPACRRAYNDSNIEWKIISPEEQKAAIAQQARKKAMARKKESEQKQAETNSRKHLAGLRVVQKNLVYVVGLSQQSSEDEFLRTLRGNQYFGQYGKIQKIVVSKAKTGSGDNSVGVYVTFEKQEDAARCIAAVDGSRNFDRPLRAQNGTTKYCSAYLRNETCQNRNCTFLHEIGEDHESFSRQDLSLMNAMSTQRPESGSPRTQPAAPVQQPSHSFLTNETDETHGPALPSSANWATRNAAAEAARLSKQSGPSAFHSSPRVTKASTVDNAARQSNASAQDRPRPSTAQNATEAKQIQPTEDLVLDSIAKKITSSSYEFTFDRSRFSEEDMKFIDSFPPLFATDGGLMQYRILQEEEQERLRRDEERNVLDTMSTAADDENLAAGSLQLGGEPDAGGEQIEGSSRPAAASRNTTQTHSESMPGMYDSGQTPLFAANASRSLGSDQLSLLQRPESARQSPVTQAATFSAASGQTSGFHSHHASNPFSAQTPNSTSLASSQGHARQASRYTFSNNSSAGPSSIKPTANPQISAQQAGLRPAAHGKLFAGQQVPPSNTGFYNTAQRPPPGLKSSTPPVSGGGMFGQGHGFANSMGGPGLGMKGVHDESINQALWSRERGSGGQGSENAKPETVPFAQSDLLSTNGDHIATPTAPGSKISSLAAPESTSADDFPSLPNFSRAPGAGSKATPSSIKPVVPKSITTTSPQKVGSIVEAAKTQSPTRKASKEELAPGALSLPKSAEQKSKIAISSPKPSTGDPVINASLSKSSQIPQVETRQGIEVPERVSVASQDSHNDLQKIEGAGSITLSGKTSRAPSIKTEGASFSRQSTPPQPAVGSRRDSIGSIQRAEKHPIDDDSVSLAFSSRPGSPSGSKNVGKKLSKTQQKKERQARARQAEEARTDIPIAGLEEPTVVQEPILGRKKKSKKSKAATVDNTPVPTRPPSPVETAVTSKKESSLPTKATVLRAEPEQPASIEQPTAKEEDVEQKDPRSSINASEGLLKDIVPSTMFASLLSTRQVGRNIEDLFKPLSTSFSRAEGASDRNYSETHFTDNQKQALSKGQTIVLSDSAEQAVVVLPDGQVLKHFTPAQAQRFQKLWLTHKAVLDETIPAFGTFLGKQALAAQKLSERPGEAGEQTLENRFTTNAYRTPANQPVEALPPAQQSSAQDAIQAESAQWSVEEADARLAAHRKDADMLEKKLNALIKKNRRMIVGGAH